MTYKHELVAALFLVISLSLCALFGWGWHQKQLRQEVEAKLLTKDLELAGAKQALLVKPKDVAPQATPDAIKAAVKKGTVIAIAGVTGTAKSDVVDIPCPEPVRPTAESLTKGLSPQEDKPTTATTTPVWFDLKGNLFIAQVKNGAALWTGSLDGRVHSGDFEAPIDFNPANVDLQVKVSDEIGKAVTFYERSWIKKHTSLVCPGVGITYNPLDTTRPVNVGITCTYGFSWF